MKVLVAEDDYVTRKLLDRHLHQWGYDVVTAENGAVALGILRGPEPPSIAILDWMMPEIDGVQLCHMIREEPSRPFVYLILLTAKGTKSDIATGLEEGADDYITKPFDPAELRARIHVGERIVRLEFDLRRKVRDLEEALNRVRTLEDLLPICMYCKRVRDDQDYWHQIESYFHQYAGTDFTHGICPDCLEQHLAKDPPA